MKIDFNMGKMAPSKAMHRLKRMVNALILPIYHIAKIIPKDNNKITIGSSQGLAFNDNSKYLYLELLKDKSKKTIWITKDRQICSNLKSLNLPCEYCYSPKGIYHQITSKFFFYSYRLSDAEPIFLGGSIKILLWHGIPIKHLSSDHATIHNKKTKEQIKKIIFKILPWIKDTECDYVLCPCPQLREIYKKQFKPRKNILTTGQPRLNAYNEENTIGIEKKAIVWLPTHRLDTKSCSAERLVNEFQKNLERIEDLLKKTKTMLYIKPHPLEALEYSKIIKESKYIKIYSEIDPYPILKYSKALITDYSSICFDYLPLTKPIIFYQPDKETYLNEVGVYYKTEDIFNDAPHAYNSQQLYHLLFELISNENPLPTTPKEINIKNIFSIHEIEEIFKNHTNKKPNHTAE